MFKRLLSAYLLAEAFDAKGSNFENKIFPSTRPFAFYFWIPISSLFINIPHRMANNWIFIFVLVLNHRGIRISIHIVRLLDLSLFSRLNRFVVLHIYLTLLYVSHQHFLENSGENLTHLFVVLCFKLKHFLRNLFLQYMASPTKYFLVLPCNHWANICHVKKKE